MNRTQATLRIEACFWRLSMLVVLLAGCKGGDGIERVVVSGQVRLHGQQVEDGQIRFIPQSDTNGPITIEPIRLGKYASDQSGGVPVGHHRIEIYAWDPKMPASRGPGSPARPQWAPAKYNSKSQLSVSLEPAKGPIVQDFDLR